MTRQVIQTSSAPAAIGTYSQAVRVGNTLFCSGQLGLDPATGNLRDTVEAQIDQAFQNVRAIATAGGATLADTVKLTLYLTDLGHFGTVNETMARYYSAPYPARSTVQVVALPKGAAFEIEALIVLP